MNPDTPAAMPVADLSAAWRSRADMLRPYAPVAAEAFDRAAAELDAALRRDADEPLTIPQAADESGYSPRHLRDMVRTGKIENVGRKHAPRVRRGDVGSKRSKTERASRLDSAAYDPTEHARRVHRLRAD